MTRAFKVNWTAQYDQTCQHCGKPFLSKKKVAKYCGDTCKRRAWREKSKAKVAVIQTASMGQTVTRVKRGRKEFFLPCDISKAKRIYGAGYSYTTIENYVRSLR